MNVRFDDTAFRDAISARNTACGTITVAEQDTPDPSPDPDPDPGPVPQDPLGGLLDSPVALGGIGVLVLLLLALAVI